MDKKIKRGDIYYADLNPVIGSEQGENRPVLIVQNDAGNKHSPTVIVTPITGNLLKNPLPTHAPLSRACGLDKESLALAEQIRSIDRSRLGNYIGHAEKSAMLRVDGALLTCIGLKRKRKKFLFLSLCSNCEKSFRSSGYVIVKKGWQEKKTLCDFCSTHNGLTFGILNE